MARSELAVEQAFIRVVLERAKMLGIKVDEDKLWRAVKKARKHNNKWFINRQQVAVVFAYAASSQLDYIDRKFREIWSKVLAPAIEVASKEYLR